MCLLRVCVCAFVTIVQCFALCTVAFYCAVPRRGRTFAVVFSCCDEHYDGCSWGPMPPHCKIPTTKKSNDAHEERRLQKERQAFEDILTVAWNTPRKRLDMLHAMKLELEAPDPEQEDKPHKITTCLSWDVASARISGKV